MQEETASRSEERQDQPQDMEVGAGSPEKAQESTGADSAAAEETREEEQGQDGGSGDVEAAEDGGSEDSGEDDGRTDIEREKDEAKKEVEALEGDPPQDLADWPSGKAKYETFGGAEHQSSYDEAATSELGPSDVRHREDGSVEVAGEQVDNPDEYKSDPIPGGPTDPNTPAGAGEPDLSKESSTVNTEDSDEQGSAQEDGSSEDEESEES